jgi:hypothetical protein
MQHELLAMIDVATERVEPGLEGHVRRRVVGTVREFGDGWEQFVREPDGESIEVEKIQVDHAFYPFRPLLAIPRPACDPPDSGGALLRIRR